MPDAPSPRSRKLLAWIVVALTVIGVSKFVDYRNQPPTPPARPAASEQ